MKQMNFQNRTQYSFWGNVEYADNKTALKARNKLAKEMKTKGLKVFCHTLPNQMRKYSGLGEYDGTIGNVYYLDVYNQE